MASDSKAVGNQVTKEIESRIKQVPEHIFEAFLEIREPVDNETPEVLLKYPSDCSEEVVKTATSFAYPCKIPPDEQSEHFAFVVLDPTSTSFRFGYCRRSNRESTCLCMISYYPWFETFYTILNDLAQMITSKATDDMEEFLSSLYNYKLMSTDEFFNNEGKEIIEVKSRSKIYTYNRPDLRKLPSMLSDRNFTVMFSRLGSEIMLRLFAHILFERRILFVSSKLFHLTACAYGCLHLIYPMHWQSIFLPIVSSSILWTTACTAPYILGVHSSVFSTLNVDELGDVVIVNIDERRLESHYDDLNLLPKYLFRSMKKGIQQSSQLAGDHLARVFLRAMACSIGNYASGFTFKNEKLDFDRDLYLEQFLGSHVHSFMSTVANTQMFEQFSRYRTYLQLQRETDVDEFDIEVKNLHQLQQSKKAANPLLEQVQNKAEKFQTVINKAGQRVASEASSVRNNLTSLDFNDVMRRNHSSKVNNSIEHNQLSALKTTHHSSTPDLLNEKPIPYERFHSGNSEPRLINGDLVDSSSSESSRSSTPEPEQYKSNPLINFDIEDNLVMPSPVVLNVINTPLATPVPRQTPQIDSKIKQLQSELQHKVQTFDGKRTDPRNEYGEQQTEIKRLVKQFDPLDDSNSSPMINRTPNTSFTSMPINLRLEQRLTSHSIGRHPSIHEAIPANRVTTLLQNIQTNFGTTSRVSARPSMPTQQRERKSPTGFSPASTAPAALFPKICSLISDDPSLSFDPLAPSKEKILLAPTPSASTTPSSETNDLWISSSLHVISVMDDSLINPVLISSSAHLEDVEQLIKNIEKQTFIADNLLNISHSSNVKETVIKSFTSNSSDIAPLDNHLLSKIIPGVNGTSNKDENVVKQRDSLDVDDVRKQQIFSATTNDQSLVHEPDTAYTWDDQYDARANYRLTFSTDRLQQADTKSDKSRRYKHQATSQQITTNYSDDDIPMNINNNMNDWSIRSSSNMLDQSMNPTPTAQQQPIPTNQSSGSSTTSSSTSWRQTKESQRTAGGMQSKDVRPPSPLCLYKIFQQKSNMNPLPTIRTIFPLNPLQRDLLTPNHNTESSTDKSNNHRRSRLSSDQAIQTSLHSAPNNRHRSTSVAARKSDSFDQLATSTRTLIHKSLPDLSFISQYTKELPRSHTTSSSILISNNTRATPSPTIIQQPKQDSDRPRTLKSIKRYKNNKHSTEPLGVFYSPQLRKTFAAVPIITESSASSPTAHINKSQAANLKSCLKAASRANSCDIQNAIEEQKSPMSNKKLMNNQHSIPQPKSPSSCIRRSPGVNKLKYLDTVWSSNKLSAYMLPDSSRGHHSEHDLISLIPGENSTKKSISFSEDISKQLLSPCNPAIAFTTDLPLEVYESNKRLTKRTTARCRDVRRCQTDIIAVDPVLHLHSFTDSPPNEFCLQRDDDQTDDDELLMKNSTINIITDLDETMPISKEIQSPSPIDQEKKSSILDDIVVTVNNIVKRLLEIKQTGKMFFLDNEQNSQLDVLLKNDLCPAIQAILEHGRKELKKTTLWKIIESSIDKHPSTTAQVPLAYQEAKLIAQNTSSYWLFKFQAFIFILLNKNELINWLYYFTRQKEILLRYYQSPDALILVSISSTFNLFERIMTQLEKLTTLTFRLTYHTPDLSSVNDEQLNTSYISIHPAKTCARDWVMTISRRNPKTFTQPILQNSSNDTFRSTLSRKFNAIFSKTNPPQQMKSSPVIATKMPDGKRQSKSPGPTRRARFSSVFSNAPTTVTTTISSPKIKYTIRPSTSPSRGATMLTQSKIPRPSLNVDKPKSVRYHSTAPS
ncbi:unnamed protein product [Adineta ricciae]|uniref:UDENN domain-containing protein n=2 Tax=Adineta ricciae TaxID=249248 RepID=A0A813RG31_ADIRI|nr:unnamed protein product [Adineta ricciae]